MAAKPKISNEQGAPAALRAIEEHELRCRQEKDAAHVEWKERLEKLVIGDEVSEQDERRAKNRYHEALELWDDATKRLALYDKQIAPEKREGEKLLRSEAERILTQAWRFQRMGRETFIIGIAQDAIHCKDETEFYAKYADSIRECESASIISGFDNERFPEWVAKCYEASL